MKAYDSLSIETNLIDYVIEIAAAWMEIHSIESIFDPKISGIKFMDDISKEIADFLAFNFLK